MAAVDAVAALVSTEVCVVTSGPGVVAEPEDVPEELLGAGSVELVVAVTAGPEVEAPGVEEVLEESSWTEQAVSMAKAAPEATMA